MQTPASAPAAQSSLRLFYRGVIAGCAGLLAASASAQSSMTTYLPPDVLTRGAEPPSTSLLKLGLFDINPHVAASALYDDNISLHSNTHQDDFIFVLSPGFDIFKPQSEEGILSTRLTYNPAFVFFAKHGTNDSIDHFLRWDGGMKLARLSVSLSQDYESSAGGVADVGSRVSQDYYLTTARIGYEVSEKTSVGVSGTYRMTEYERLIGSREWIEDNVAYYALSPKLQLGIGVSVGQLITENPPADFFGYRVSTGANTQTFVTPSLRATYRTTEKTDVSASLGWEYRSYQDGHDGFDPVFSVTGTYRPWDHTAISLEGHRREQSSAVLQGQDYIATGLSIALTRTFRDRYRAHVNFTYDNSEYQAATRGVRATRADDYFLLRSGVDAILAHSWTLGLFHQYRVNESTGGGFNFDNHQVGVQTVWSY